MLLTILSMFFTNPAPLDMPRAEAYLVREGSRAYLEDRFDRLDLWVSQTLIGRWTDEQERCFLLSALTTCPPAVERNGVETRVEYEAHRTPMKRVRSNAGFPSSFREAVETLSPVALAAEPRSPRQLPRGYKEVYYWQEPTNYSDIVCTFLPEHTNVWFLATWKLAQGDDYPAQMSAFEDRFLKTDFSSLISRLRFSGEVRKTKDSKNERELLRRDARHSVAAYRNWHFTDAEEFAVLDDLPSHGFVETLTNDFPVMRTKYAAAIPSPLDCSHTLSVVRIYATRDEYLDALETDGLTNMTWSAAYWSPQRRELVAYLPENGGEELRRTIRHEAFHQFLSYATSMIAASPWFNEGYAQYFEDDLSEDWGEGFDLTEENLERYAAAIPGVLMMDYGRFYEGSDSWRRFKYRLAWAIVRFIEKGADEVRRKPFAGLKERYMESLLRTKDMRSATMAAFKNEELLKKFISEWKKFWEKR